MQREHSNSRIMCCYSMVIWDRLDAQRRQSKLVFCWAGASEDVWRQSNDLFGKRCARWSRQYQDDSESAPENGNGCGLAKRKAGGAWGEVSLESAGTKTKDLNPPRLHPQRFCFSSSGVGSPGIHSFWKLPGESNMQPRLRTSASGQRLYDKYFQVCVKGCRLVGKTAPHLCPIVEIGLLSVYLRWWGECSGLWIC